MNKLATFFKFGTISLVVAAAVQCSSYSGKDVAQDAKQDANGKTHRVKDDKQDANSKIHGVKDVAQDASQDDEGKIH
jgi:hypothetical protein